MACLTFFLWNKIVVVISSPKRKSTCWESDWHWRDHHLMCPGQAGGDTGSLQLRLWWVVSKRSAAAIPLSACCRVNQKLEERGIERARERERLSTLTRSQACQSRHESNKGRKGGRRESGSLPVGLTKKRCEDREEVRRRRGENNAEGESCRDHLKGRNVLFFLHALSSVVGYSPTGETNCLLI